MKNWVRILPFTDTKLYGSSNSYYSSHMQVKYSVSSASVTQEFFKHISALNLLCYITMLYICKHLAYTYMHAYKYMNIYKYMNMHTYLLVQNTPWQEVSAQILCGLTSSTVK